MDARAADQERPAPHATHQPQLCTGKLVYYDSVRWGLIYANPPHRTEDRCPPHYALLGTSWSGRPITQNPASVPVFGTCCPLPATDILTDTEVEVIEACPENHVAVGTSHKCETCAPKLVCALINTDRYLLSGLQSGFKWGVNSAPWRHPRVLSKSDLPAGLRVGLSRGQRFKSYLSGCVGEPFGALLVEKKGKYCHEFFYKELLYKGLAGDPPARTPVPIYPNCEHLVEDAEGEFRCEN